jgi:glyoxylase-like metal-dependent hydrolase (beta-lactamase superfamily II)
MEFSLTPFEELRPGAWRAVAQPAAVNIGLVTGTSGALLIDTGSSPAQGAQVRAAAEAMLDVPLVGVVVTHAHFDHYYGLAAFDDLPTYGHESLAAALSAEQVGEEAAELGFDQHDLRAPNRPLALAKMVDLGDRYAEIVHFGRGHTAGDVVVVVPDLQLIFTGDLLEQSAPPAMGPDCHLKEWPAALDGILGLVNAGTLLVPGHGRPFDQVFAFTQRAEISSVYGQAEYLVGQGVRQEDALAAGEWQFDDATIAAVLPIAYRQLAAEGKVPRPTLRVL